MVGFFFLCILLFIIARNLSNRPNSLVFPKDLSINLAAFIWYVCSEFESPSTVVSCRISSTSSSVSFDGGDSDEFEGELLSCVLNKVMGCIWLVELGVHSLMRVLVDRGLWFVLMLLDWVSSTVVVAAELLSSMWDV